MEGEGAQWELKTSSAPSLYGHPARIASPLHPIREGLRAWTLVSRILSSNLEKEGHLLQPPLHAAICYINPWHVRIGSDLRHCLDQPNPCILLLKK